MLKSIWNPCVIPNMNYKAQRCWCRRFLNRLLGLPVARQNLLFSYFACTLTAEIRAAKAEGRYFEGVSDLSGSNITEILQPKASQGFCPSIHVPLIYRLLAVLAT